jgi:hypothetical protein
MSDMMEEKLKKEGVLEKYGMEYILKEKLF